MTALQTPGRSPDGLIRGRDDPAGGGDQVRMRAHYGHQATVLTISGDVDATTGGRVHDFVTRFVLLGNALILDLRGVEFFSARGISVLIAVDDACRTTDVAWALVPSPIVSRVLQLTNCDTTLPSASSVPDARGQLAAPTRTRRLRSRDHPRPTPGGVTPRSASNDSQFPKESGITMNVPPAGSPLFLPAPVFTLGSALRWLGHDCPRHRRCCAPIESMAASVWFLRGGLPFPTFPFQTRVVVDPTESGDTLADLCRLIDQVNGCTRRDAIEVRHRPRRVGDHPTRLVPLRAPAPLLGAPGPACLHDGPDPREDDLRTMEATQS